MLGEASEHRLIRLHHNVGPPVKRKQIDQQLECRL